MNKDIISKLKNEDLTDYQSIPFWSWNNELDINELLKQIEDMKKRRIGGFIMHARTGLTTPYLGEKWFDCIKACLDKAKELHMQGWIYDENGWPSGFVGGELLKEKENLATYLTMKENDSFDEGAFANYIKRDGKFVKLQKCMPISGVCYSVYLNYSPANTDILNPKVVDKFISMTYEKYYEKFSSRFGKELAGFFTDEPQYFRYSTPYSIVLDDEYRKLYGEEITDGLIHLFFDSPEDYPFRVRYYKLINKVYTENYYKRLNDWCNSHGCKFTGHSVEENKLFTQMWGCAGVMPSYEYESIPAIDNLANCFDAQLSARQLGSVKEQLGFKQTLSETFGCSGYNATPRRLRAIGDSQYVRGVTKMCQHLYSFSLKGQGKMDHPPCFSPHMPWNEEFTYFNDHFTHIGYLLSNSKSLANALVISPLSSVYLEYKRNDEAKSQIFDIELEKLQKTLKNNNIDYHFADENLLEKYGKTDNGTLELGKMKYEFVILPYIKNMFASTKKLLEKFVKEGGKVYLYNGVPEYTDGIKDDYTFLKSNIELKDIYDGSPVKFSASVPVEYTYRSGDGFKMLYLFNESNEHSHITLDKEYKLLNTVTLNVKSVTELDLYAEDSAVLLDTDIKAEKEVAAENEEDITDKFRFTGISDNNLTVDYVYASKDGKNFGARRYCYELLEELIKERYNGPLYLKYVFKADGVKKLKMLKEKDNGKNYKLNGKDITFVQSDFDIYFEEADMEKYIVDGDNTFEYAVDFYENPNINFALFDPEATESVRNILSYDTEIEPIYISGKFITDGVEIKPADEKIEIKNIDKQGYKFFAGTADFKAEFVAKKSKAEIIIDGDYMVARLKVNGKKFTVCLTNRTEIPLNKGENNLVELTLVTSLRNKFGPFHCLAEDSVGVSPVNFAMRGMWQNGTNGLYTEEYRTCPFGVNGIRLKY